MREVFEYTQFWAVGSGTRVRARRDVRALSAAQDRRGGRAAPASRPAPRSTNSGAADDAVHGESQVSAGLRTSARHRFAVALRLRRRGRARRAREAVADVARDPAIRIAYPPSLKRVLAELTAAAALLASALKFDGRLIGPAGRRRPGAAARRRVQRRRSRCARRRNGTSRRCVRCPTTRRSTELAGGALHGAARDHARPARTRGRCTRASSRSRPRRSRRRSSTTSRRPSRSRASSRSIVDDGERRGPSAAAHAGVRTGRRRDLGARRSRRSSAAPPELIVGATNSDSGLRDAVRGTTTCACSRRRPPRFECSCSRARVEDALRIAGRDEIEAALRRRRRGRGRRASSAAALHVRAGRGARAVRTAARARRGSPDATLMALYVPRAFAVDDRSSDSTS